MTRTMIDIEDLLIWAYRDQAVDEAKGRVAGPSVALMRWPVADDCTTVEVEVHPDAWVVHAAVRRLSRVEAGLVIGCAKTATRPDWLPGARPVMVATPTSRGNPAKLYDASRHVIGHKVHCGLEVEGGAILDGMTEGDLITLRRHYTLWRDALVALADHLGSGNALEAYDVGFPRALPMPWVHV